VDADRTPLAPGGDCGPENAGPQTLPRERVAAAAPGKDAARRARIEAYLRQLTKARKIIAFIEQERHEQWPDFRRIANAAKAAGYYSSRTTPQTIEASLTGTWRRCKYWLSEQALTFRFCGEKL